MNRLLVALASGLLFGIGLGVSGMTQPKKVIAFLDLANWDPTLMFVMAGAILVHSIAYHMTKHSESPLLEAKFHLPTRNDLDGKLILGSIIFGVGWALGGFCPGPAITSMASLQMNVLVFVLLMMIGMYAHAFVEKVTTKRKE